MSCIISFLLVMSWMAGGERKVARCAFSEVAKIIADSGREISIMSSGDGLEQ